MWRAGQRVGGALVDVPVVDTDGSSLRLVLGDGGHPAIARRDLLLGPWRVQLDVLAASHRITVVEATGGGSLAETVACGTGAIRPVADHLPHRYSWHVPWGRAEFTSTAHHGDRALAAARRAWSDRGVARGLTVRFPGNDDAVTALAVEDATSTTLSWRTWHCYPGDRAHVVTTTTRLEACQ
jgi:hypothetical protein